MLTEVEAVKQQATLTVSELEEALKSASRQTGESKEEVRNAVESLTQSISQVRDGVKTELDNAIAEMRKAVEQQEKTIGDLVSNSEARLIQAEKAQKISVDGSLEQFDKLRDVKFKEIDIHFRSHFAAGEIVVLPQNARRHIRRTGRHGRELKAPSRKLT